MSPETNAVVDPTLARQLAAREEKRYGYLHAGLAVINGLAVLTQALTAPVVAIIIAVVSVVITVGSIAWFAQRMPRTMGRLMSITRAFWLGWLITWVATLLLGWLLMRWLFYVGAVAMLVVGGIAAFRALQHARRGVATPNATF